MNLTKPQKLIYDMEKFSGGAISVICGSMLARGEKDISEIKRAVNEIYRLNDALRIRVVECDGEVSQNVCEYTKQDIPVLCFENKAELDRYAESYAKVAVDLYRNLCEINIVVLPEQYGLLVKMHHIVGDAWTLALIGTQFNAFMNGEDVQAYSYTEYVESEKNYVEGKRYAKDREFFLEQFKKCDEVTYLNEKQTSSLSASRKTFIIDAEQTKELNAYAEANNTSAFMLFTAGLSAYMNRTKMNAEKFYIGTAVLNRSGAKEKNTMGMFINTVPMLIELDNAKSFAENLSAIEKTVFSVFRHQKYNYGDVLASIRKEYNFTEKLYDVMISYQNATIAGEDIETTWYHCGEQSENLQIHIDDRDNEGIFRIHYDYLNDKFTECEIDRLHQHICNLLFDAVKDSNKKLWELNILSADERQKLLYDFNDTSVDYPKDKCVHQLFEKQVEIVPNKIAVIYKDARLTYAQLKSVVDDYVSKLCYMGIKQNDVVAIHLGRSYRLIAFQLAVLKIGAIFLPVDKRYPTDRIEYMCKDCDVKFIVSDEIEKCGFNANVIKLKDFESIVTNVTADTTNNSNVCYMIYTSGSTGTPKGCMLTGKGLINFCKNNNTLETLNKINDCVFACVNSVSFDYFIAESLLPLTNGFTTVIFDDNESTIQEQFLEVVSKNNINVVMTTPTRLKIYFDDKYDCVSLQNLECICTSGEPLSAELLDTMYKKAPNAQIYNPIGPSECSIWNIGGRLERESGIDIHIGKPIANTQIYIVDKYMRPTPIGITGELCITGDGVGAGYLNRPELTAEKFIDNPFGEGKLYKTGDLAYWREDGNIAYVGRNDFQVKIRGLRIELGEIENAICGIDGISQAVVVVRKNNDGRQLICAFYTGAEVDAKDIRAHIGKKLPKYMLPHIFTHLNEMPLTSSGKVNRKALPKVDLENISNDTEYVMPETQMQKALCKLIELVLGTSPVGITDDFFDLGGDSLKAIEFVSKAHNEGIYFNLQNVFDYPTVSQLCECIESGDKPTVSYADVDFTAINMLLQKNKLECITSPKTQEVGNILLAGATGYLGTHILADYLDNDTGTAYCLVRGKNKAYSTKRLQDLLNFYFGDKYANTERIEVICADLQKDKLGLSDTEYSELADQVDTVINCAASVKHYGTYPYFYEVNVDTVKRLVAVCKSAKSKFIHISTLSVSGNGFDTESCDEKTFSEADFYIGQPLDNVYARSKFEAEKVVLEAMVEGLRANIMRMGNLTNRNSDGMFQMNYESNAFFKRIKALSELGAYPHSILAYDVEFTPIDEAANAVMSVVRHFDNEKTVFHINNPKAIKLHKMFEIFKALGIEINGIDDFTFAEMLKELSKQKDKAHIYEAFINDFNDVSQINYDSDICIENDFTVQYLKSLGFEWADIDIDYLSKYVEYFKKIGVLK